MLQVGCFSAVAGVAAAISLAVDSRSGPPLAVNQSERTRSIDSPTRHCQSAECSESTGRRRSKTLLPLRSAADRAARITTSPPATIVSLFAIATATPASRAATVAGRPTTPVVAISAISGAKSRTSERRSSALPPTRLRAWGLVFASASCCSPPRPEASATSSKTSGCCAMTSAACSPIEPLAPSSATRIRPTLPSQDECGDERDGRCKQKAIDPIKYAAMTWN